MPVDRKYERDIDLLLAEEFAVSPAFAAWMRSQTAFADVESNVLDVFVSRSDATGESDVVVVFEEPDGARRFALLIEDKIDAVLQPNQEQRYRLRAKNEVDRGDYQAFEILLCAPKAYAAGHSGSAGFDRIITYEAIAEFLETDLSLRGQYRSNFVRTAALRNAKTWSRISDDVTNAFWTAAHHLAVTEFPILEFKMPAVTKGSSWIEIRPRDLPTKPKTYVLMKGDRGYMDLTFAGSSVALFAEAVIPLLDSGMSIHKTGKSAAIRIEVECFTPFDALDIGITKLRSAFAACSVLISFYRSHRRLLDEAAQAASST